MENKKTLTVQLGKHTVLELSYYIDEKELNINVHDRRYSDDLGHVEVVYTDNTINAIDSLAFIFSSLKEVYEEVDPNDLKDEINLAKFKLHTLEMKSADFSAKNDEVIELV